MDNSIRVENWKSKKAKLAIIEKMITYVGLEYQKLGGEVFSDFIFAQEDPQTKEMVGLLEHLSKNNVKQDVHKDVTLLIAHADFLKELEEVKRDLVKMINELQPETHKEAPVPRVNS